MHTYPNTAILGMGFLGRPLAEQLYSYGSHIFALKQHLTSDDINLPISLTTTDLNQPTVFQEPFWQQWSECPLWICLLPPSAVSDYANTVQKWVTLAESHQVEHLIYASSTSVYGNTPRHCTEHTPTDASTPSSQKIIAAENILQNSRIKNIDILRFGGLYHSERHPITSLLQRPHITGAHQPVNMIHRDYAIAALLHAAATPSGHRLRNIVEPTHPSKYEFYQQEAIKLGLPVPNFDLTDTQSGKIVDTAFEDFKIHL